MNFLNVFILKAKGKLCQLVSFQWIAQISVPFLTKPKAKHAAAAKVL